MVVLLLLVFAAVLPLCALVLAVIDAARAAPDYAQVTRDYSPEGLRARKWRRVLDLALLGGGVVLASAAGIVSELS